LRHELIIGEENMPRKKPEETKLSAADNINYVMPTTEFPFVYANNAVMSMNDLDGSIIFGEVVAKDGDKQTVVPKVKVVMAAPFVRRLRDLLVSWPWDDEPKKD
jgi:hypothetical protein